MADRERTLDVVVVGLGRGGGRLAGEFSRRGYRTLVFHTSARGRKEQEHVPDHACFSIGEEDGRARDSEEVRRRIRANARRLEDLIAAETRQADLVLITAGLCGATGSQAAALASVVDRSAAPVMVMASLPSDGETVERKVTALRAARELTRAELDGLIFIDEARLLELDSDASILDVYERMNRRIVEPLDALNRLPADPTTHAVSSLDGKRLQEILTAGGVVAYGATDVRELTPEEIGQAVLDELSSSSIVASGIAPVTVSSMQIVIEAPEECLARTPARLEEHLRERWRSETAGASVDVSIYRSEGNGPTVRVLASCAGIPARMEQLVTETAAEVRARRDKPRRTPTLDLTALDDLDSHEEGHGNGPPHVPPAPRRRRISDIAPKPAPASTASRIPTPSKFSLTAAPPRVPITALPSPATPTRVLEAQAAAGNQKASRAVYARLVTRYKSTSNEELRRAIARRLEQDRTSEDEKIRLLAVYAMAKIGTHLFGSSLVAATEDAAPKVREAAERALAIVGSHSTLVRASTG